MRQFPNCLSVHDAQCGEGKGVLARVKGLFPCGGGKSHALEQLRQALISRAYTVWSAYSRAIWHHPPGLMQSCRGSNWLYGARSLGKAGKTQNWGSNFLPMKFFVSAEKSVTVVLSWLQYLPKVLLCLTASPPYPSFSWDKVFGFVTPVSGRRQRWGWGVGMHVRLEICCP